MKIALVHRYYPMPGGVTTLVEEMRKEFERIGIDYEIITQKPVNGIKNVISLNKKSGFAFYSACTSYIKNGNFDIIHTHSYPLVFFQPFLNENIVLTIHGYERDFERTSFWNSFMQNQVYRNLKILSYKMASHLVPTSSLLFDNLTKNYGISSKKITIIPSCVNINFFKPLKNKKKDKIVRIFQYSTSKRKGFDYILKWTNEISKKNNNFRFVVVGGELKDIPTQLRKYFELLGQAPYKEMPKIYNSCDIVVLASLVEPFGLTPGEGMACGKVPIVSVNCGIKDIITNNVDGFVCDFEEFPKKLEILINNKKLREKMSKKTRKKVIEKLSIERVTNQYINLYNRLLKS